MNDGIIRFEIPGQPVPWAPARLDGAVYVTAPEVADHRVTIARAWEVAGRPRADDADAISIAVTFYLDRPRSHYRTARHCRVLRNDAPPRPICRPDVDSLSRLVLATLNGRLYRDDAQVVCIAAAGKHWAPHGEAPRTVINAWIASATRHAAATR